MDNTERLATLGKQDTYRRRQTKHNKTQTPQKPQPHVTILLNILNQLMTVLKSVSYCHIYILNSNFWITL
jgi:hypothetical protein